MNPSTFDKGFKKQLEAQINIEYLYPYTLEAQKLSPFLFRKLGNIKFYNKYDLMDDNFCLKRTTTESDFASGLYRVLSEIQFFP